MGGFDIEDFLARPLVCHIAATGPVVLPVWFLWEDGYFWILTGPWSSLPGAIRTEPAVALAVDACDLVTGETRQIVARGRGELVGFDVDRGRRLLERYLGADVGGWDPRFRSFLGVSSGPSTAGTVWARVFPERLAVRDLSFRGSLHSGGEAPTGGVGVSTGAGAVRLAAAADLDHLAVLLGTLFEQEHDFIPNVAAQRRGLEALLADGRARVLLAERDGRVVGMVSVQILTSTVAGGPVALLEDLVVDAGVRGQGIGSLLVEAAIGQAEALGCHRVSLLTDGDNLRSQRLYQRHGFAISPMVTMRRRSGQSISGEIPLNRRTDR